MEEIIEEWNIVEALGDSNNILSLRWEIKFTMGEYVSYHKGLTVVSIPAVNITKESLIVYLKENFKDYVPVKEHALELLRLKKSMAEAQTVHLINKTFAEIEDPLFDEPPIEIL